MAKGILGRKIGMTQLMDEDGTATPVTVIKAGPCVVVAKKTREKDGYDAVQIGFEERAERHTNMPMRGHFAKARVRPQKYLREVPLAPDSDVDVGDAVTVGILKEGDIVDVTGTSKGKGFAGGMKRHGFKGGPASHGASKIHRKPQSSGATDAARTFKGTKKPGQMGNARVTVRGLKVLRADPERNLLILKGHVPGANGGLLLIRAR